MRLDDCQGEPVPGEAIPGPLQWDAHRPEPDAWDAWGGAHPAVAEAEVLQLLPEPGGADAERLAGPARDDPEPDAFQWARLFVMAVAPDAEAEPCTPDAGRSEERSCEVQEAAGVLAEWQAEAQPQAAAERRMPLRQGSAAAEQPQPGVQEEPDAAQWSGLQRARVDAAELPPEQLVESQAEAASQAFRPAQPAEPRPQAL